VLLTTIHICHWHKIYHIVLHAECNHQAVVMHCEWYLKHIAAQTITCRLLHIRACWDSNSTWSICCRHIQARVQQISDIHAGDVRNGWSLNLHCCSYLMAFTQYEDTKGNTNVEIGDDWGLWVTQGDHKNNNSIEHIRFPIQL